MDDEPKNREQRHRRRQGWKFTFFGETPEKRDEEGHLAKFAPELTQNEWRMKQVFPLSNTQVGDRVVIAQILSGKGMIYRLSQMGLTLGSEVRVISKTMSGSVIVCIQDEQIGLGAGMANKVMVTLAAGRS
jgi:ferrous iron transport protein A